MGVELVIRLVAILLAALATGGLVVTSIAVFGALFGGIAMAVIFSRANSAPGQLAIPGAVCHAGVLALAYRPMCALISSLLARRSSPRVTTGGAIRRGWIRYHVLRTLVWFPGLICYILSELLGAR